MLNTLPGKWRLPIAALGASLLLSLPSWAATAPTQNPPHTVYGTAPPVTLLLYSLAPDLLAGWNFPLNKMGGLGMSANSEYLLPATRNLPVLGGWDPGDKPELERVLAIHPKLALLWAPYLDNARLRNELQRIDVPTLAVNLGSLDDYPAAYRLLGDQLGQAARGEKLATAFQNILNRLQNLRSSIPQAQRQTVYYAEGVDGLMTDTANSPHTQVIRAAGGDNVFTGKATALKGMERVSMGQVLAWNPDVILVQDPVFYRRVYSLPAWHGLKAVKDHRVYLVPRQPFNWMDRPPSFMQGLGALWLAHALYPQQSKVHLNQEIQDFFKTFLQVNVTKAQARSTWQS
ncbi:MAG: ABC transporter substrate-binding protein [Acidithiobacillus sp.]